MERGRMERQGIPVVCGLILAGALAGGCGTTRAQIKDTGPRVETAFVEDDPDDDWLDPLEGDADDLPEDHRVLPALSVAGTVYVLANETVELPAATETSAGDLFRLVSESPVVYQMDPDPLCTTDPKADFCADEDLRAVTERDWEVYQGQKPVCSGPLGEPVILSFLYPGEEWIREIGSEAAPRALQDPAVVAAAFDYLAWPVQGECPLSVADVSHGGDCLYQAVPEILWAAPVGRAPRSVEAFVTASDEDPVQRTRGLVGWAEVEEAALGEIDETGRTDEESCRETRDTVFFAAGGPTMCSDEDEPGGGPACGWYYVILAVGDDPGGCQMMCGAGTLRSALWRVTEGSWDLLGSWEDAWILPLLVGDLDRDQDPELLARTEFGEWSYSLFDIELDPPSVSELPVWEVGAGCVDCWCLDFDVQVMDANPGGL